MIDEARETLLARLRAGPDFLAAPPGGARGGWRDRLRTLARTGRSIAEDHLYDAVHGIDTTARVESWRLEGVVGDHADQACHYSPTRGRQVEHVLDQLALPPGLGLLDVGCGKGLVLFRASRGPFRRIVGIEHAASVLEVARDNLRRFQARTGRGETIELHHVDAATWPVPTDLHVAYLFNPFGAPVFAHFLDRLHESHAAAPRPLWLVVNKADHGERIAARGLLRETRRIRYGSADMRIYQNEEALTGA